MNLRLVLKSPSSVPVEVEGVTPDAVRDKPLAEIERLPIFHGNRPVPLAEFFGVSGDPADGRMEWEGDLSGVHWIGAAMSGGRIQIAGNAGRHVGSEMSGGEIVVDGDAGDWVGGEMHGGLIHVRGRAGHLVGAAYRGSARGMTGGTILVAGPVGNEIGHTMRRGLLAVGGAGDLAGFNMLAGSILIFGSAGIRNGAGMRRGTIALLGTGTPPLLPSFRFACRYRPEVMALLLRHVRSLGFPPSAELDGSEFDLFNGDLIEGGRGELLVRR
ncbi:MAG: formylmethanofuran dehydrogenase subunit C [Candidatus Anammoximicrobium sp.]|nr:formylmethanofuran dehydrogenase subunit C [Candidatus Anammoximicrobium sp.]